MESMPRSLNVAPSGISSFSAISATRARRSSRSFGLAFELDISVLLLGQSLLDDVEKIGNGVEACEALVGDLDAHLPLERADDLEHAQRVDRQLADHGRLEDVMK